jgi:outer membrane protein
MKNAVLRGILGGLLACACVTALAQDATLDRARQLIQAKQFKEAYALLEPQETARAGNPDFDYLLGIAAIDAGQLTRGVFALERVLAVNPNHTQARAEIARAYFLMGENRTARAEFDAVKGQRPPAEVQSTVDRFLDALDARERARHTGYTGYLELGLGHDTNANSATGAASFAVPAFGGAVFTLAPGAAQQDDNFWTLAGGVNGRYGLTENLGLVGSASFDRRMNFKLEQFNTGSLGATGGLSLRSGTDEYLAALQVQKFTVEDDWFRDAYGVVGQFRRTLSPSDQVSAYTQYTKLRYPTQPLRDADRVVFGGAWAHSYAAAGSPITYAGAYVGREEATGRNVPHFGHDLWGVRVGGQVGLSEKWTFAASGVYEQRRHHGPDPLFVVKRKDKDLQLRASAIYQADKNWSVTPAIAFSEVTSNIVVNTYDRLVFSVTARYDFR